MKKSIIGIMIGIIHSTNTYSATDAQGNAVATSAVTSKDQVAGSYHYTYDDGYLSSAESPYKFKSTENGGSYDISYYDTVNDKDIKLTFNEDADSHIGADGGVDYAINADDSSAYYEGDLVDGVKIKATNSSAVVIYKGYTNKAEIENSSGSTLFLDSNNAEGAQITNNPDSFAYIINNIATSASINNYNSAYIYIKNNNAGNATILNSGTAVVINNAVDNATIINDNGTIDLIYNNASGAKISNANGGVLTARNNKIDNDSIISNKDTSTAYLIENSVSSAEIINKNAKMYLSGNSAKSSVVINENGSIYIDKNTISNYSSVENSGVIKATLNTVSSSSFNSTDGSILLYGNNVSNTSINNSAESVLVIGDCVAGDENGCTKSTKTTANNSTIDTVGKAILSGTLLGSNNNISNSGTAILEGLSARGTDIVNSGYISLLKDTSSSIGNLTNSGYILLSSGTNTANILTVDGNYEGINGNVVFNSKLNGDNSSTNKLIITGNASGTTYVTVDNQGGNGSQTLEGIELISTGSSTADAFVQSGRIVVGSYEYHLQQGTASGTNMNNWYLTSQSDNSGNDSNAGTAHIYRPERGSYASNLQAAATMFDMRLKDRQGGNVYIDPLTGERHKSNLWVRSVGGHSEGRISDGQSKYSTNRMVFQLGGAVLNGSLGADDAWHLGLMGGYGKQYSNTHNSLSGYNSKGSVWGYSTGIYGTWYQNANNKTGLYADSWLAWNWFDNSVKGDELSYEKYKSKGVTASLETGYVFHTGSYMTSGGMENNVYVTPQAQVLWSGVKADDHTEANGTTVEGRGSDNVQTRLGVRLSMTGQSHLDKGSVRQFEPFVEANWLYTSKDYGVKMGDNSAYLQGNRNVAELKTGVEGHVTENLSVWGSVAQQIGGNNYQGTQGVLGVKYSF
ncbi:hypothetical protein CBW22_22880 [Pantoea sp. VS1]|uniref:autotransporter outer membrane beta-barrel domain-containing protein n=1 Tax=Pantoea sp. VS1 TaxID=2003658 RepID=UPI000B50864C|nr:autotransporter outer membrane beta-barrel domain-containing protein [Pantoea sp. VS1]OWS73345.1 hypothetical protein CBW22_22880 [Pantoea sp. VS1]